MKAIILNSGKGKRMGELTTEKPKCMVKLNEETILGRQLRLLSVFDFTDAIITTGPFENKLKEHAEEITDLNIEYVHNPEYNSTNYIYSLYLVNNIIREEDVLLLHGDLCFDGKVLKKLLRDRSSALINTDEDAPDKDFDAFIEDGFLMEIGVDLVHANTVGFMPFYNLANSDFVKWMQSMKRYVDQGERGVYAEEALNPLLDNGEVKIKGVNYSNSFCMEIDTPDDLIRAKQKLGELNG